MRVFENLAKGYPTISMPDLIYFLERNRFFPRREDVEAILRRCDHDANRSISYAEFSELVGMEEQMSSAYEASASGSAEACVAKDGELP